MRKKACWAVLLGMCMLLATAAVAEEAGQALSLSEIGVTTVFPAGWTVVTPETAGDHLALFDDPTAEAAAENLRAEGVYALAVSPEGDATLRLMVRAEEGDVALYYDIERYTPAMRTAIKNDFLDREAWALTGYRFTSAEWTNREGQGRILNLQYTVRSGEEVVARGRRAYTIRNGLAISLDLLVEGRKIETQDERVFNAFLRDTVLPESTDMPLLPVGLTLTGVVPEETDKAEMAIRGETTPGALVKAMVMPPQSNEATQVGQVKAPASGTFRLDIVLPEQGEWRLLLEAELEGMASSGDTRWISYDSRRLPVTFTSYPEGDYYEAQVVISGKTLPGVAIQCMEGDVNKKTTTGSDGTFSFKMDRTVTGNRTVVLSLTKKNYDYRRFDIQFNRQWEREEYVKHLAGQVQSLSFENLSERPDKYLGRLVKYSGEVLNVSTAGVRTYVQLGVKQDKDGRWTERIIAVADGLEVALQEGDQASIYFEVTGESYAFSEVTLDGDEIDIDLPSVRMLTYTRDGSA